MTKPFAWSVVMLLGLAGCSQRDRTAVIYGGGGPAGEASVALGLGRDMTWIATQMEPRSDWPAIRTGLRLDEVTYYDRIIFDRERHSDRHGSIFHRNESYQTGIWIR